MIRIEGAPIIGATLAAALKSTKAVDNPRSHHRPQVRQSLSPTLAISVLARRSAAARAST